MRPLDNLRNIGISAHIDSGKTTLTERILFYTGIIHAIHEVKGKDGVGATMDSMDLERERGITIQSAATRVAWKKTPFYLKPEEAKNIDINIIDTPGHVDFTIEVERSLRVLDGAILVLCGVSGVQSQSITVDRQMRRYSVPRVAFINKLDRSGANPFRVTEQLRDKLNHNAVMMQIPIGVEDKHEGLVDLLTMKAYKFEGPNGETINEIPIPDDLKETAEKRRTIMLDALSHFSDELTELILEEKEIPLDLLKNVVRAATIKMELTPVFMGSAFKNKGVQLLLDGVADFLPSPYDVDNFALDISTKDETKIKMESDASKPFVGYAFKLEEGRFGQLTYLRVYQGKVEKGKPIYNMSTKKKHNVGRLVRMHANEMGDITSAEAGDIVALFGIDCATGTTFTDGTLEVNMTSMHVPNAVIDLVIEAKNRDHLANLSKALNRFTKEDPTFRVKLDEESGQTIISGMGELHLDVYIERMRREYGVELTTGRPQVAYREAISQRAEFNYTHKKQTGGSGQYGRVAGYIEPIPEEEAKDYEFVDDIVGGVIPREFIPSCDKGFQGCLSSGSVIGFPIVRIRCVINDGQQHPVDSSDIAFQLAARGGFREAYPKAKPVVLEPIMKLEVSAPTEFQGTVMGQINQKRGMITGSTEEQNFTIIQAEVPLSEMFGYATDLRSGTQGKAEFTMEFLKYSPVPKNVGEELIKKYSAQAKGRVE
ncbi:MAG TPA: elongation factor G [Fibrobacteres bacterium]|jgi:elongation factor G|nr:elongation factor G [Fibrobacterota bacterium]